MKVRRNLKQYVTATVIGAQVAAAGLLSLPALAASPMSVTAIGPSNASPGQTIMYQVTVTNTGGSTVTGAALGANNPSNGAVRMSFLATLSTPGCTQQYPGGAPQVWCPAMTYAPGQSRNFQLAFQIPSNAAVGSAFDGVFDIWSANAEPNWSNHVTTTVVSGLGGGGGRGFGGGFTNTTFTGNANTTVNNQVNAASQNNTQVWQQQQNNQPANTWMNATINPTATTTVNNGINAAAQNNTDLKTFNPWGGWNNTNVNTNANTGVNNAVNAASQNNTALWQQQQNNMPWGGGMNANVSPTATTTVNNGINAGSNNTFGGWWW